MHVIKTNVLEARYSNMLVPNSEYHVVAFGATNVRN